MSRTFSTKLRIFGKFEVLHATRLRSESPPNAHDGRLGQAGFLCHEPRAPVRAVGRHRFQGFRDYLFDLCVGDRAGSAGTRFVEQTFQTLHPKSLSPLAHRSPGDVQSFRDLPVAQSFAAAEDDTGAHGHSLCGLGPARQD